MVEYRLKHETLVEEVSVNKDTFFNSNVIKREFKDHLGNIHTVVQFGEVKETTHVKFHTVIPDIDLFLNDTKLQSMLKSINFLQAKEGVLIFLNEDMANRESQKDYGIGAQILNSLKITGIKLLTSGGKHSYVGLNGFGLEIVEEIQIEG